MVVAQSIAAGSIFLLQAALLVVAILIGVGCLIALCVIWFCATSNKTLWF